MSSTPHLHDKHVSTDKNVTPDSTRKNSRVMDAYMESYAAVLAAAENMGSPACDLLEKAI